MAASSSSNAAHQTPALVADVETLRGAWHLVFRADGSVLGDASRAAFTELVNMYSEPHRAYHTTRHVADCISQAQAAMSDWRAPSAALCALLFHDVVYDPTSKSNEDDSADLAAAAIEKLIVSKGAESSSAKDLSAEVQRLILLTKHSAQPSDDDGDGRLLIDIDLSILGAPRKAYDAYDRAIRREYCSVPAEAYRAGRTAVLKSFLSREHIFLTERYRREREAAARDNLAVSIARLADPSIPVDEDGET
jgi:predicted metal-dependent HD superfamily phosphohydrolase